MASYAIAGSWLRVQAPGHGSLAVAAAKAPCELYSQFHKGGLGCIGFWV